MLEFSLVECGLETVADACARKGWARKTLQNWIAAGLVAAAPVRAPGGGVYLLRVADVDAFVPPVRGRPVIARRAKAPRTRKPKATKSNKAAARTGSKRAAGAR